MNSIIGNLYIPKDNSWVGIYDEDGKVISASLVGNGDEIEGLDPFLGVRYKPVYTECEIVSEPFKEDVDLIGKPISKFFVKVTAYGLTYRVLWNPAWMTAKKAKIAEDIDLSELSNDELANIILEAQRLLKERNV